MRILSIDFDAIMFPCIRLYNDSCAGQENDTRIWEQLEARYGIKDFLSYDANLYAQIAKVVAKNVKYGAKFIPIQEHDELVTYLRDNNYMQTDMNIVNLDYHHDIMYHRESISSILDFDKWSCADWLGYLLLKNHNNVGTWIRCPGSDNYHPEYSGQDFGERFSVKNLKDLDEIFEEPFDLVFLCLSPQWVPHQYHHLYDIIVDVAKIFSTPLELPMSSIEDIAPTEENIISFPAPEPEGDEETHD